MRWQADELAMMTALSGDPPRSRVLSRRCWSSSCGARGHAVRVSRRQADERRHQDLHLRRIRGVLRPVARLYRLGLVRAYDVLRHRQLCVAIALYSMGAELGGGRGSASSSACRWRAAGARHRAVLAAGRGDLLRHDHAGGGVRLPGAGLATVMAHRRRGRPQLSAAGIAAAGHGPHFEGPCSASPSTAAC